MGSRSSPLRCADELDTPHGSEPQGFRLCCEPGWIALPVERCTQVLRLLSQCGDALMLSRDRVGLLLHNGVEQEYAEHSDRENESETRGESCFTTARWRRTTAHQR